ncbi:MAG: hypothetical protein O3A22_04300 [Bacteroidetes bacterium]|jgi:hypothetical protein|nr:hypothetical protein [Bacteroidota bacterium]
MKENPYQVPPNFFEKQKAEILSLVAPKKTASVFSLKKTGLVSIAASLAAVAFVLSPWITDSETPCISYACLLESIKLDDLSESEELLMQEWEDDEFEEEFGVYLF